jgi:acyl carrier protein
LSTESRVIKVVSALLVRQKRSGDGVSGASRLYAGGLGFDSLAAAELSTLLEMEFGSDPYSEGKIPQTMSDIVTFYDASAAAR